MKNQFLSTFLIASVFLPVSSVAFAESPLRSDRRSPDENSLKESGTENSAGADPINGAALKARSEMNFFEKPGSGWIIQGVPTLAMGAAFIAAGMFPSPVVFFLFAPGVVLGVGGGLMVGLGDDRNNKFDVGQIDYTSPMAGYVAGGAINMVIGALVTCGGSAIYRTSNAKGLGIGTLVTGGVYMGYGLGFFIYGLAYDFKKDADQLPPVKKVLGSLTPFVGCTGGMCDGNTTRTTGRETYFGGIRGEF